MKLYELQRAIEKLLPNALVSEDQHGQIVVYTNLMVDEKTRCRDHELIEYDEE